MAKDKEDCAKLAVQKLLSDMKDRGGIGNAIEQIDDETLDEMMTTWRGIILQAFKDA